MIESVGPWPENAVADINHARSKLMERGCPLKTEVATLFGPKEILNSLDYFLSNTDLTYRTALETNGLAKIIKDDRETKVTLVFGDEECIINGIKPSITKKCSFCPNTFRLHREAIKLIDGRLVCNECYAKMFDAILGVQTER